MLIRHLACHVADPERSRDFYLQTIGLDAEAAVEPWGIRLELPDGFMFALIRGEPVADGTDAVHFGCALDSPEEVRAIRERLRAAGVPEFEWWDEPGHRSCKVLDPDGYVVELSYDPA
ncbi:MAG: hypothetical protein KatS3mg010_1171 [Acidimicrobiia bacterium]|nr:MAG: hypothetical protein KatS3mg010_1171 [Acidimicrobiia bacterium]